MGSDGEITPYYVSASLSGAQKLRDYRDWLWGQVGRPDEYRKVAPHVTVHSRMWMDRAALREATNALAGLTGAEVRSTGLEAYPSPEEPAVLSVGLDFGGELEAAREATAAVDGADCGEPSPPHATLMKVPGPVYEADTSELGQVTEAVGWREGDFSGWTTEVDEVYVTPKDDS